MGGTWALVPVRAIAGGKRRLAGVLAPALRERLVLAMLEDVLAAIVQAPGLAGLALASADPQAARLGRRYGARLLGEGNGLNGTLDAAAADLFRGRAGAVMVVPADVPLVGPEDIGAALAALARGAGAVLAEAAADGGTNLIGFRASAAISFAFGVGSFAAHREALRAKAVEPVVLARPGLAFDVDRADDVVALMGRGRETRAGRVLIDAGVVPSALACREAS